MLKDPQYDSYIFVWSFRNVERSAARIRQESPNDRTIFVKYKSRDYYKYYSKAQYAVRNARLPEGITKKRNQVHIQTWHGTPLKRLGHDLQGKGVNPNYTLKESRDKYDRDIKDCDYMLSASKFCTEKLISSFNLKGLAKENIIIEEGYPRNDFLFNATNEDVSRIRAEIGIPEDKKVILYAPTWRDAFHATGEGYTYDLSIDFERLQEVFQDEYVILLRAHYLIANSFDLEKFKGFVFDLSEYDDINHLYVVADLLVTDYSSVFFDYANLKRPIIFYMYDLKHYESEARGFYLSLAELPGPIVETEDALIGAIQAAGELSDKYEEPYPQFNKKFNYLDDGKAGERVLQRIGV